MARDIETYSEKLRAAGSDTAQVNSRLLGIIDAAESAEALSASGSAPGDKFDDKFRSGDEGFTSVMAGIKGATRNIATSFAEMSKGQYDAATTLENGEIDAVNGFRTI